MADPTGGKELQGEDTEGDEKCQHHWTELRDDGRILKCLRCELEWAGDSAVRLIAASAHARITDLTTTIGMLAEHCKIQFCTGCSPPNLLTIPLGKSGIVLRELEDDVSCPSCLLTYLREHREDGSDLTQETIEDIVEWIREYHLQPSSDGGSDLLLLEDAPEQLPLILGEFPEIAEALYVVPLTPSAPSTDA